MKKMTMISAAFLALAFAVPAGIAGTTHIQTVETGHNTEPVYNSTTGAHMGWTANLGDTHEFTLWNSQWTGGATSAVNDLLNEPTGASLPMFRGVSVTLMDANACPNGEYADGICGNGPSNYVRFVDAGGPFRAGLDCEILEDFTPADPNATPPTVDTWTSNAGNSNTVDDFMHPEYVLFGDGVLYAGFLQVEGDMERFQVTPDAGTTIYDWWATEFIYIDTFDTDFWFKTTLDGEQCVALDSLSNEVTLDWASPIGDLTRYNLI